MKKTLLAILAATVLGPMTANADFISGSIAFTGDWVRTGGSGLADATGIDFTTDLVVQGASGTYGVIPTDGSVSAIFNDFDFEPSFVSNNPLWSVIYAGVTYSFALNSVMVQEPRNAFSLVLFGSGVASVSVSGDNLYEDTVGTWVFTGNSFTFSGVNEVPEPATLAIFGLGLAAFGFASRRKATKS